MPIWLRKFTFNKLQEFYEKQKEANEKVNTPVKNKTKKPTFITKASK